MITRIIKITALFIMLIIAAGASAYLTLHMIIKGHEPIAVPDITGKNAVTALHMLSDLGLNTRVKGMAYHDTVPENHVIFQKPEAGALIKKGRDVQLTLSKGTRTMIMPDLKGMPADHALLLVEQNNLCKGIVSRTLTANRPGHDVLDQTPAPGAVISKETCVNLLVSGGIRPKAFNMPDLVAQSLISAESIFNLLEIQMDDVQSAYTSEYPINTIIMQNPPPGCRIEAGSTVKLTINRPPGDPASGYLTGYLTGGLFSYQADPGFLNRRIRIELTLFGLTGDYFNGFLKPGEKITVCIPRGLEAAVRVYENEELVAFRIFK